MANKDRKRNNGGTTVLTAILVVVILIVGAVSYFGYTELKRIEAAAAGGGDAVLEQRVQKLEERAAAVVKKVEGDATTPDVDAEKIAAMEQRIDQLEQGLQSAAPTTGDGTAMAVSGEPCDCEQLNERLSGLENAVASLKPESAGTASRVTPTEKKAEAQVSEKTTPARKVERAPKSRSRSVAVKRPRSRKPRAATALAPAAVQPATRDFQRAGTNPYDLEEGERGYRSLYEISRGFGPTYGYSANQERGLSKLSPGVAVYPSTDTPYATTSTTYMDRTFSE